MKLAIAIAVVLMVVAGGVAAFLMLTEEEQADLAEKLQPPPTCAKRPEI